MGKICSNCGKELSDNAKFCSKCGSKCEEVVQEKKVKRMCQKCGHELDEKMKFCPKCGTEIKTVESRDKNGCFDTVSKFSFVSYQILIIFSATFTTTPFLYI